MYITSEILCAINTTIGGPYYTIDFSLGGNSEGSCVIFSVHF